MNKTARITLSAMLLIGCAFTVKAEKPWNYSEDLWHGKGAQPNFEFWNKSKDPNNSVYVAVMKHEEFGGFGENLLKNNFKKDLDRVTQKRINEDINAYNIKNAGDAVGRWVRSGDAIQAWGGNDPIGLILATKSQKPVYWHFTPGKNIFVAYRGGSVSNKGKDAFGPQTGPMKGLKRRTESFLKFEGKKVKLDDFSGPDASLNLNR